MNIMGVDVYTDNAIPVDLVVVKGDRYELVELGEER